MKASNFLPQHVRDDQCLPENPPRYEASRCHPIHLLVCPNQSRVFVMEYVFVILYLLEHVDCIMDSMQFQCQEGRAGIRYRHIMVPLSAENDILEYFWSILA